MSIFRLPVSLPAPLNAFRGNVLDICLRFRIPPFSTIVRPRRAVPPCSPLPVPPCLASSRSPSRLIVSLYPVLVPLVSTLFFPSGLFPSPLPSCRPVAAIIAPPVVSWGGEWGVAIRCDTLWQPPSCWHPLCSIGVPKLAPSIVSSCGEGGGEGNHCPCHLRVCAVSV